MMSLTGLLKGHIQSQGKLLITLLLGKAYWKLVFACGCMQLCRACTAGLWVKQMDAGAAVSPSDVAELLTEGK